MAGVPRPEMRPVSPHVSASGDGTSTMLSSILHRVTGVGLYGAAMFVCGLVDDRRCRAGSLRPRWQQFLRLAPGQVVMLYLIVAALAYHLANGIRHLMFDTGAGLTRSDADTSAWFAILFAIAAPIGLWALVTFGA